MSDFQIIDGPGDAKNLIFATWLRSYQANALAAKHMSRDTFFAGHHGVLERIFGNEPCVKLAVMPEDPSVVFGWSVSEPDKGIVHYVYVKPAFRRHGVAKALLEHVKLPCVYTHHTYILRDLHKYVAGSDYNPYAI